MDFEIREGAIKTVLRMEMPATVQLDVDMVRASIISAVQKITQSDIDAIQPNKEGSTIVAVTITHSIDREEKARERPVLIFSEETTRALQDMRELLRNTRYGTRMYTKSTRAIIGALLEQSSYITEENLHRVTSYAITTIREVISSFNADAKFLKAPFQVDIEWIDPTTAKKGRKVKLRMKKDSD